MDSDRRKEIAKLRYELNLRIIDFDGLVTENARFTNEVRKYGFDSDDTKFRLTNMNRNMIRAKLDIEEAEKLLEHREKMYTKKKVELSPVGLWEDWKKNVGCVGCVGSTATLPLGESEILASDQSLRFTLHTLHTPYTIPNKNK
jgi:hypothetical protein